MSASDYLDDRRIVREALRLLGVVSRQSSLQFTITEYPGFSLGAQDLASWAYCVMPSIPVAMCRRGWRDDYARAFKFLRKEHSKRLFGSKRRQSP